VARGWSALHGHVRDGFEQNQSSVSCDHPKNHPTEASTAGNGLIGSPLLNDMTQIQVRGVRSARPFHELRPRGTTKMEPLVMPMVTLVLVDKEKITKTKPTVSCDYSSRWKRERPWWEHFPPLSLLPGVSYDSGTRFKNTITYKPRELSWFNVLSWIEFWIQDSNFFKGTLTAASHEEFLTLKNSKNDPVPLYFVDSGTTIPIHHPFDQLIMVRAQGDPPKEFYLNNVKVKFEPTGRASYNLDISTSPTTRWVSPLPLDEYKNRKPIDTYSILLTSDILRDLGKVVGLGEDPGTGQGIPPEKGKFIYLTAVNAAGWAVDINNPTAKEPASIPVELKYNFIIDPANSPIEKLKIWDGNTTRNVERRRGELWPAAAYCCPDVALGFCTCPTN